MSSTETILPPRVISLSKLKADVDLQNAGDWIEIPELDGVSVKVRSLRSAQYQSAVTPIRQKHQRKFGDKGPPPAIFAQDFGRIIANIILLDWKGLDVEYSDDVAYETMTDPGYAELLGYVIVAAGKVAQGDIEYVETAAKNSA